jgi:hypothetical protein
MHDPRVFRGSNVTNKLMSSSLQDKKISKDILRRVDRKRLPYNGLMRGSSPPAVSGRQHADIQTEEYLHPLEVLSDRAVESDMSTQTPAALDKPSLPLFVRAKTGIDVDTQILAGDLFDFDLEVEPLLEVLVGRTLHVSMLEVMQEEELEAIRLQQEEFEAVRNIELAEVQRLEAESRRKTQEKQRRKLQEQLRLDEQRGLEAKVAARAFAQQYLGVLHEDVFEALEAEGKFVDPLRREVEEVFIPSLLAGVSLHLVAHSQAAMLLLKLLEEANESAAVEADRAHQVRIERQEREDIDRHLREDEEEESRRLLEQRAAGRGAEEDEEGAEIANDE